MTHEVLFLLTARNEFDRASTWYDQQRAGLGNSFILAIAEILNRVSLHVDFYPQVFLDVREAAVSRFPYCVYYRVDGLSVLVISVFHTSRNPLVWQRRS